jgi:hypothetical protein
MGDGELSAVEQKIVDSLRHTHALNLVNNFLLAEIVRDQTGAASNRHDYLVGMFERFSARADQLPIDTQSHLANDLFREELSKFFAQIAWRPEPRQSTDMTEC